MVVSRLLVAVFLCVISTFVSSASALPRENASVDKAAEQQASRGATTVPATNPTRLRVNDARPAGFQLKVKWETGKLTLDAEAVPLSEVLQAISRETGIEITGAEVLSDPVSTHLAGVELFQALRDLLSHVDYAITTGLEGSSSPQGAGVVIIARPPPTAEPETSTAKTEPSAVGQDSEPTVTADAPAEELVPQASELVAAQGAAWAENPPTVDQSQPVPSQPPQNEPQGVTTTSPQGELSNTDPSANANAVPQSTGSMDAAALDAFTETLPGAESPPDAEQAEKLAAVKAAAAIQDWGALGKYMQDANAAVQAAAFDTLAAYDNPWAVENLLAQINDASQPNRLQALEILNQAPQADEQTVMTTLVEALDGTDSSLSSYAAQALAARGTPDAMNALNQLLGESNPSTRLMILQSVAQTDAGLSLLRAALSDSDETVRNTAASLLKAVQTTNKQ